MDALIEYLIDQLWLSLVLAAVVGVALIWRIGKDFARVALQERNGD